MAGIRSTLIKEKNMITNYEATVVTTDDIVHEVNLEGKRIGYVIKTENKVDYNVRRLEKLITVKEDILKNRFEILNKL